MKKLINKDAVNSQGIKKSDILDASYNDEIGKLWTASGIRSFILKAAEEKMKPKSDNKVDGDNPAYQ